MQPQQATSTMVIREILDLSPNIARVHVIEFPFKPVLQERLQLRPGEEMQISKALSIRESLGLQFWDALMLTCLSNADLSERLLEQVKAHNSQNKVVSLSSQDDEFEAYVRNRANVNMAFLSKVVLDSGEERHLPLLDFHCSNSAINLALSIAVLKQLQIGPGYLLESGDSYHYYGMQLLSFEEHVQFLGLALHYSPIVDKVWIAHQLRELTSALRITPKHGVTPRLVARFDAEVGA